MNLIHSKEGLAPVAPVAGKVLEALHFGLLHLEHVFLVPQMVSVSGALSAKEEGAAASAVFFYYKSVLHFCVIISTHTQTHIKPSLTVLQQELEKDLLKF